MSEETQETSPTEAREESSTEPTRKAAKKAAKRTAKKAVRKTATRRKKTVPAADDSRANLDLEASSPEKVESIEQNNSSTKSKNTSTEESQPKRGERDARTQVRSDEFETAGAPLVAREQEEGQQKSDRATRGRRGDRKGNQESQESSDSPESKHRQDRESDDDRDQRGRGNRRKGRRRRGRRLPEVRVDPEEVAKKAWKIFQAEVAEEGLALIDEVTGREAAKRSFKLAESFLVESSRYSAALARAIKEAAEENADEEE